MTKRSWIRNLFTRSATRPIRKAPRRVRLGVEVLEDRWVPSTMIVVNNPTDMPVMGQTDLRQAILQANTNGGDEAIVFDSTVFATPQTINLGGTQLELSDTTGTETITGPAAGVTVNAGGASSVFQVDGLVTASISGLTITGGSSYGGGGGGVNNGGTLALTNCTVSGNSSGGSGAGGGGVNNVGSLTMTNCTVSGNTAAGSIFGFGGGVLNDGTATLTNCTVSGNSASGSHGGYGGGVDNNYGSLTMTNCTVSGNSTSGLYGKGGGVNNIRGTATLTNCTVSGNSTVGRERGSGGGVYSYGTLALTNCTVSGNSASGIYGYGGGVFNSNTAKLTNTIVAGNTATTSGPDVVGGFGSLGNNLIGKTDSSSGWIGSDLTGTIASPLNPLLASLGNYGGPTQTMALLPGSPAINAGTSGAGIPATDQRGALRDSHPDIGAFEVVHTFVVTTTADENNGTPNPSVGAGTSLREAIDFSNLNPGADTITFDPTVFATPQTITLTEGQLELSDTTGTETITGPAAGVTVSGNNASRVFQVDGLVTASISGLTITGGSAGGGGGVDNRGSLALTGCTVSGNSAHGYGAGGGGGVDNRGSLTMTNCTVSGNSAAGLSIGFGGGVGNSGSLAMTNCTVSGNSASGIFNGYGGGVDNNGGSLTMTNCTVSGNSASGSDGHGGGVNNIRGTATLTNCTVSGNSAAGGRGSGGGVYSYGTLALTNCTVSGNSASGNSDYGFGGGVYNTGTLALTNCTVSGNSASGIFGGYGGGLINFNTTKLTNTIVAGNTATTTGPDVQGTFGSLGNNLIGKTDGSSGWIGSDLTGTIASPLNPLLAPLGNYGGPTQTMALLPGSPAINAGTSGAGTPTTDQRGLGRVGAVDIGAFESQGFTIAVTSGSGQATFISTSFAAPLVATVTANNPSEPVAGGQVTFTPPVSGASATITGSPATISAAGAASVTATANGVKGTYNVTATARGITTPANFSLTNGPIITVPAAQSAYEDVDKAISGITIGDAATATLTVTLKVSHGKLTIGTTTGLTVGGNGTGSVTLTGTTANLNAALATLVYRGVLNYSGGDTLNITATHGTVSATPASVAITVVSAAQQAANLQAQVSALQTAGVLNSGLATLLKTTLNLQGNVGDIVRVTAFIVEVDVLQLTGILTPAQANALLGPGNILLLSVTRR